VPTLVSANLAAARRDHVRRGLRSEWTAVSFFVLFAIQSLCWDRGASKRGVRRSWRAAAYRSWIAAAGSLLIVPVATYLVCWLGWFAGGNSWNRH